MSTLEKTKIDFQDQLLLNGGQKYCRMLQGEHSAILSTYIKLPFVIEIFVLSIFEWPFYTMFYCISIKHSVCLNRSNVHLIGCIWCAFSM